MLEAFGVILLATSWLVTNHYQPWWSFYTESVAISALVLLLIASRMRDKLTMPRAGWVLVAIAPLPMVHWAVGRVPFLSDAWASTLFLVCAIGAVCLGSNSGKSKDPAAADRVAMAIVFGAVASACISLVQALDVDLLGSFVLETYSLSRTAANLGQPNNLTTLTGLGLASLWWLNERKRLSQITGALLAALLIMGLALTQSRTALLFGPAVVSILCLARIRGIRLETRISVVIGAVAIATVAMFMWPMIQKLLLISVETNYTVVGRGSSSVRLHMWPWMLDAAAHSPWIGHGWLQVGAAQLSVAEKHATGELWFYAHNLFLDLILWMGWPLGLAASGAVLWWFASRTARLRDAQGVIAMSAVLVFFVHAMLELPHQFAYLLIPAGFFVGVVEARTALPASITSPRRDAGVWLIGLIVVMGALLAKDYLRVEDDFRRMRFETTRIGTPPPPQPAPDAPFLSGITSFAWFSRHEPQPGLTKEELSKFESVARRFPYSSSVAKLARAYAAHGDIDQAHRMFVKLDAMFGTGECRFARFEIEERVAQGRSDLVPLLNRLNAAPDTCGAAEARAR